MNFRLLVFLFPLFLLNWSCTDEEEQPVEKIEPTKDYPKEESKLFKLLDKVETGISFQNTLVEDYETNIIRYDYLYNGGGVGIADFDNDGLEDVFFTGNQVNDKLYRNLGDLKFEDISASSGVNKVNGWSTGVSIADVNSDGWKDIYVCRSGMGDPSSQTNVLYINNGDLTFTEKAEEFGINYSGQSTQAAFYDFDKDGDLDLYLMTHPKAFGEKISSKQIKELADQGLLEQDVYYENVNGNFIDKTKESGIFDIGFGLGICLSDFNRDGLMDIYISNDYDEGDAMYINLGNGKFENKINVLLRHTANYGMGCDIGDINNDGYLDIMSLDMAFESHTRSKRNMASMDPEKFYKRVMIGWHYQYMHNMLHLNNGDGSYSEISQMAGVHKSDWSWAVLFADFDNNGWSDIFVTNGYKRDTKDRDYKKKLSEMASEREGNALKIEEILNSIPATKIKNYIFSNNQDLTFKKNNENWGFNEEVNSNGAAYSDLDNDGDLDLVLNNMDEFASIYENQSSSENWVVFELKGNEYPRIEIRSQGKVQVKDSHPVRGYLSTVSERVHFGLEDSIIDTVLVHWPDQIMMLNNVNSNAFTTIERNDGTPYQETDKQTVKGGYFRECMKDYNIIYRHKENVYDDFERDILLPHRVSQYGPHISSGDLNGDGRTDFFIGGAQGQPGKVFFQTSNGKFERQSAKTLETSSEVNYEDMGSLIYDFDSDNDNDLFIVSGGGENVDGDPLLEDRLYENLGRGLSPKLDIFEDVNYTAGMRAVTGDLDCDGIPELIVGGRVVGDKYPSPPKSSIYKLKEGKYVDVTRQVSPGFEYCGMITDLKLFDEDGDQDMDLLVVGEWMSPLLFINSDGILKLDQEKIPSNLEGWYFSCQVEDLDNDGDMDILLGNLGENNKFNPNPLHPLKIYADDFDENGTHDIVLAKFEDDILYPVRGRECSSDQMPFIEDKFETFESFAVAELNEIYSPVKLQSAIHFEAKNFQSGILINNNGLYEFQPFDKRSQIAPIMDVVCVDVNQDGLKDLLYLGNFHGVEVETTRYDAGNGGLLLNKGNLEFEFVPSYLSGFSSPADSRDLELIECINGKKIVLVANNSNLMQAFEILE